jgi:hypothetical protein
MKFRRMVKALYIFAIILSAHTYSFTDLMREYKNFEELITIDSPIVHLDGASDSNAITTINRANQKQWTFIVYMAADNDLRAFAANNIRQMASLGSNQHVNIVAHLDIRLNGNQKVTRRYYIENNKLNLLNSEPETQHMDSGDPNTLISCCEWAINTFPAENYALIFWNHGTGIIDPVNYKVINPAELFSFNTKTNQLELDRSVGFLDFLHFADLDQRGICWDNSTGNYLTNDKVNSALHDICNRVLKKKFSIIGFDACLMSMIEVGHIIKNYADIMVGSQEVELGTGWNYAYVLQPLLQGGISPEDFARHIVSAYQQSYQTITADFTQSAMDLRQSSALEKNVDEVAQILLELLRYQEKKSILQAIKASKHKKYCTHFDEPSYIDLHHFYTNLQKRIPQKSVAKSRRGLVAQLHSKLSQGKQLISQIAFANTAGKNLSNARGISIYFPDQRIHPSYGHTSFARSNAWYKLVHQCK